MDRTCVLVFLSSLTQPPHVLMYIYLVAKIGLLVPDHRL